MKKQQTDSGDSGEKSSMSYWEEWMNGFHYLLRQIFRPWAHGTTEEYCTACGLYRIKDGLRDTKCRCYYERP